MIKKFTIDHVNVPQDRQYRNLGDPGTGTEVRGQFRVRHKRGNNDLHLQAGAVIKHLPKAYDLWYTPSRQLGIFGSL